MSENTHILVVGGVRVDFLVRGEKLPAAGDFIIGEDFRRALGGMGANQAVAASRAGAEVHLLAAVGEDRDGAQAIRSLKASGVNTALCRGFKQARTGVAVVTIGANGGSGTMAVMGANDLLSADVLNGVDWGAYGAVLLQNEIPKETTWEAIRQASAQTKVFLTPGPKMEIPRELLGLIDGLILNRGLLRSLGYTGPQDPGLRALALELRLGVAVTLGHRGVIWYGADGRTTKVTPPNVQQLDSVGAEDCFAAYFAEAMAREQSVPQALRRACFASALKLNRKGSQSTYPAASEVDAFIAVCP